MKKEVSTMLPAALLGWYQFRVNGKALYITGGDSVFEVLFDVLKEKGLTVTKASYDALGDSIGKYDYIVAIDVLERVKLPVDFLKKIKGLLAMDGRLFMGVDNRFAIRYFCGDKDKYSKHVLDGLDNYRKVSKRRLEVMEGRAYDKAEIEEFLEEAGLSWRQFYSVLPSIKRPQILFKYGYRPNEPLDIRIFPQYTSAETVYLEEELLYDSLIRNDMFHQMANGYLIECSLNGKVCDADQITVQGDRACDQAMATIIKKDNWVVKKALYKEAIPKLKMLMGNNEYLKAHQVSVIDARLEDDRYIMDYKQGQIATVHFRELLRASKGEFYQEILEWKRIIENSSEHVPYSQVDWKKFEPEWEKRKADDPNLCKWKKLAYGTEEDKKSIGVILKRGYIDMVSLNCFHTIEGYVFFDQEFYIENFPANAILIRTIDFIYKDCPEMEQLYKREDLLKDLNLYEHMRVWRKKAKGFLAELRNERQLAEYHQKYRRDSKQVQVNRHRMDYPQEEYEKLFCDIFKDTDKKKVYLFGSGKYASDFIDRFGEYYEIAGLLDNNSEKWGEKIAGISIMSPEVLAIEKMPYKVYICIKDFEDVLEQLKEMGVRSIAVFDSRLDYERPRKLVLQSESAKSKMYHIGYVAGVFDLFHKGHLNLLRRAKEQCDYLIVGVVSDEQVIQNKMTKPYISFEERREIVEACKYVDEAVKIPMDKPDTEDAWRLYHFDVQFSGSDYEKDSVWMAKKAFLQQHGADMVFFPYTESTSSTYIKEKIRKGNK